MVEMLGKKDARQIIQRLGGKRIYVPFSDYLTSHHKLSKALGYRLAKRFCQCYAGDKIIIPTGAKIRRAEVISVLHQAGLASHEISWYTGCTSRRVQQILSKPLPKL